MTDDPAVQTLVDAVRDALSPLPEGSCVVAGASGGPDSAGLLALVAHARPDLDLQVLHVRHGLRDDRSDLAAVTAQVTRLGSQLAVVEVQVRPAGQGPEAAAREARHDALQLHAAQLGAAAVLLGHTADDQAETVLLRLARGTTLHGAAGMRPWRDHDGGVPVVRPLLGLRRADVHGFAAGLGLAVVQDPTNDDRAFARNVVRHDVLPDLARHAGDPVAALARFADRAAEDDGALLRLARAWSGTHGRQFAGVEVVPAARFDALDVAVRRRVAGLLLGRVRPESAVADEVDEVLALADGGSVDRRGVLVGRSGGWLTFAGGRVPPLDPVDLGEAPGLVVRLPGPAVLEVRVPGAAGEPEDRPAAVVPGGDPTRLAVTLPEPEHGLRLRARQPGDRVRARAGTKLVADVLADAGVPRSLRDVVPVLADGDRVLWVAGLEADADALDAGRAHPWRHLALLAP